METQTGDSGEELDAFDIIDDLGFGLDFNSDAPQMKWKAYFTQRAYDIVKRDPEGYIYEKNGQEYVKVYDNQVIPFIVHMRIAGIDNDLGENDSIFGSGCRYELDDE